SILGEEIGPAFRKRHYSKIRNSEAKPILDRVERKFEVYFADVLLDMDDNDEEDADAILAVMSHDELDSEEIEAFVLRQTKLLPTLEEVPTRFKSMVIRHARVSPEWSNCLAFTQSETFESDALIAFLGNDEVCAALLKTPVPETEEALPLRQFLIEAQALGDEAYRLYVRALPHEFKKFPEPVCAQKRRILIDERRVTFNSQSLAMLNGEVDLQTAFVAQNIASYLCDTTSFSIDDDFRERLLATDISDDEKRALIGLMDLSDLPSRPERAAVVGPILLRTNGTLPSLTPDIIKAVVVNAKPVGAQVRLLNLLHETLDPNEVREILGKLPCPYSKIQTGYARPTLKRTDENSELVRWLDDRDIISSVGTPFWSNDILVNLYRS
ncbi:MAG: ATP-binding protein, partial [Myxococcota bacterium]